MSVYEEVTQAIIAELEKGVPPWVKSWQSQLPQNLLSKREYRGINVILLWSRGYTSPYWLTFRQAGALGGKIKKGSKATRIVYAAKAVKKDEEKGSNCKPIEELYLKD
jgi:antirestriction protein ArdC